jgi:hypothetical protein
MWQFVVKTKAATVAAWKLVIRTKAVRKRRNAICHVENQKWNTRFGKIRRI